MNDRFVLTMEAARTELYVRMPTIFARKTQPYPGVKSCLGDPIGTFNGRHWWYATGNVREIFEEIENDVQNQLLATLTDKYRGIVHFKLVMIGGDQISAKPTIMFFCEEKEPRKKAKKVLDEGGLLTRMPGFRTGHQARQPSVGRLIQPAENSEGTSVPEKIVQHKVFYYDPLNSINAIQDRIHDVRWWARLSRSRGRRHEDIRQ
jgi:hypothetical protein